MKIIAHLCLAFAFACVSLTAWAQQMVKCKQADGSYTFQDTACPESSKQELMRFDKHGNVKAAANTSESDANQNEIAASRSVKSMANRVPISNPDAKLDSEPAPNQGSESTQAKQNEQSGAGDSASTSTSASTFASGNDSTPTEETSAPKPNPGLLALFFFGAILSIVATIWLLVAAFRVSILWGLMCLFIPFCMLLFVILHWENAKRPFCISIVAFALMIFPAVKGYNLSRASSGKSAEARPNDLKVPGVRRTA